MRKELKKYYRKSNRGRSLRISVFAVAILSAVGILSGCSSSVDKALNESDAVSALQSEIHEVIRDNYLKNGTGSEREEYQGLFDAIPKSDFHIAEPYLIFSDKNYQMANSDPPSYYLLKYSGDKIDENAVSGAKTLIFARPAYAAGQTYNKISGQGRNMGGAGVISYSMDIYYYDVETRIIIGYEKIKAPPFPDKLPTAQTAVRPSNDEAIAAVEARAARK